MNPARALGIALLLIAAAVLGKQAGAKSCPRHSPLAGTLAWAVALGCATGGLWLIAVGPG